MNTVDKTNQKQPNKSRKHIVHTANYILACAVKSLYADVVLVDGNINDHEFYYDFDRFHFKKEMLLDIKKRMEEIIANNINLCMTKISVDKAKEIFKHNPYKLELIQQNAQKNIFSCEMEANDKKEKFSDLIFLNEMLNNTSELKAFELLGDAGAYWQGNANKPMLTRINGVAFTNTKELKSYLKQREELLSRSQSKLGKELGLYTMIEEVGQGLPLFTPKGTALKKVLENFVEREETRRGYQFTSTPLMAKEALYKLSGHWHHYKEHMFVIPTLKPTDAKELKDDSEKSCFALRPMTCPFHFFLYNQTKHSYRELPIRYAETSTLFRNESSGEMHGLMRLRQLTLADGHIICEPHQLQAEFSASLDLAIYILQTLGLTDYYYRFSKWDANNSAKYIDAPAMWEKVEIEMKNILDDAKVPYTESIGEAAFYGPKLDLQMKNVFGKEDTIVTIQVDFALAEKFNMLYTDKDGSDKYPMIIHRSSIGCYERTIAFLIEKYGGKFPFWMAPEQVRIVTVSSEVHDYAKALKDNFMANDLRVFVDSREETLGKKIREAQKLKVPCTLVVGKQEKQANTMSVRTLNGKVTSQLSIEMFLQQCNQMIAEHSLSNIFDEDF